jgi:hypothetical protein
MALSSLHVMQRSMRTLDFCDKLNHAKFKCLVSLEFQWANHSFSRSRVEEIELVHVEAAVSLQQMRLLLVLVLGVVVEAQINLVIGNNLDFRNNRNTDSRFGSHLQRCLELLLSNSML